MVRGLGRLGARVRGPAGRPDFDDGGVSLMARWVVEAAWRGLTTVRYLGAGRQVQNGRS